MVLTLCWSKLWELMRKVSAIPVLKGIHEGIWSGNLQGILGEDSCTTGSDFCLSWIFPFWNIHQNGGISRTFDLFLDRLVCECQIFVAHTHTHVVPQSKWEVEECSLAGALTTLPRHHHPWCTTCGELPRYMTLCQVGEWSRTSARSVKIREDPHWMIRFLDGCLNYWSGAHFRQDHNVNMPPATLSWGPPMI